jgi:hypothetical protein
MNDIQGIKIWGRHLKLIQAVCIPNNNTFTVIKAVFLGVKEEVKAICADMIAKKRITLETSPDPVLNPALVSDQRFWPKIVIRKIPQFDYDVGEVFYPEMLDTIVTGNDATIALHAFPVFHQKYGADIPLLREYSPILWDLATSNGYTAEITGIGLPKGEKVHILNFPGPEVFERNLLERMPQIYALARTIVKDDMSGLGRAA